MVPMNELASVTNFRSVGRARTQDGMLRQGLLFRCGDLADLDPGDARRLQSLGIDVICDLRSERERQSRVSRIPDFWKVKTYTYNLTSPTSSKLLALVRNGNAKPQDLVDYLRQRNQDFATLLAPEFGRLLGHVAALPARSGVLIHCAAGKDRTGFAVALLQLALGVSERDVMDEYLATARFLDSALLTKREIASFEQGGYGTIDAASYQPMTEVRPEYLESALVHIRGRGTETFLRESAQVDQTTLAKLRRRLIERGA